MRPLLLLLVGCLKPGFSVHGSLPVPDPAACPAFAEPPSAPDGAVATEGRSRPSPTEEQAQERAFADATRRARALGVAPYADADLGAAGDDASFTVGETLDPVEAWIAAARITDTCVMPVPGEDPPRFVAWVRITLPEPER